MNLVRGFLGIVIVLVGTTTLEPRSIFSKIKQCELKMTSVLKKPERRLNNALLRAREDISEPLVEFKEKITGPIRGNIKQAFDPAHLRDTQVSVRMGNALGDKEQAFLGRRGTVTDHGFFQLLGYRPARKPVIAFCCSGGGYRALVGTSGFLQGMQEIGLFDCATYASYLSGSTWFAASWLMSGKTPSQFNEDIRQRVGLTLTELIFDTTEMYQELITKFSLSRKPLTVLDVWGRVLGHRLLLETGDPRNFAHLEDLAKNCDAGENPLPLFAAVIRQKSDRNRYKWFEFSPYESGSEYLNGWIDSWAMGRMFKDGKSTNVAYQYTLGYLMGLWGSAFTATVEEAIEQTLKGVSLGAWYRAWAQLMVNPLMLSHRIEPAQVPNFVYGLPTCALSDERVIEVTDAGIVCNLPIVPLLRTDRNIDIIIIADMTVPNKRTDMLRYCAAYAQQNNRPFPTIPARPLNDDGIEIFYEAGKPVVMYLPCVRNPGYLAQFDPAKADYCSLYNFKYAPQQFDELSGLMKYQVTSHREEIIRTIQTWIDAAA